MEAQRKRQGCLLGGLSGSSACVCLYFSICYSLLRAVLYLEGSPPLPFPSLQEKPQEQGERGVRWEQEEVGWVGEIAGHLRVEGNEEFSCPSGGSSPGQGVPELSLGTQCGCLGSSLCTLSCSNSQAHCSPLASTARVCPCLLRLPYPQFPRDRTI